MHRIAWLVFTLIPLRLFAADLNEELLTAARKGDVAAVTQLLEKGAAIETKTAYGQTPLYLAAMSGHDDLVRFLLEKGASPDVTDTFYKAPMLIFAITRSHFTTAKLLIEKGTGDPDQLLTQLVQAGNVELLQALLDKSKPGQAALDSAYESAQQRNQIWVAAVLKKAGAREPAPPPKLDAKLLDSYAGNYKSEGIPIGIKAFVRDGVLIMQPEGQKEFPLTPKSETVFQFTPAQITVEFSSAASFTLKQGTMSYLFKKAVTQ